MKANFLTVIAAGLGLFLCTRPMLAHHSFSTEYDSAKPVTLTGTVTNVGWMNPHARFYIDVKDEKGEVANWELELGSPNGLMRQGWTRHSVKKGDIVTITGSLAKDGSKLVNARTVKLADGREVSAGSSETRPTDVLKELLKDGKIKR